MKKEQKTPDQIAYEKRQIDTLQAGIDELVTKIPKGHSNWSYQKSVDFKQAIGNALKEVKKQRKSLLACSGYSLN